MVTALVSAFTGRPVNNLVAMTGEVSLRGRVLPIGGLKEKALGALRAGIRQILIPEKNKKDLYDIPKNVKSRIRFTCVSDVNQVLEIALEPAPDEPDMPESEGPETQASETRAVPEEKSPQEGQAQAGQEKPDTGQDGPV
jgi:ATP-dependent Lon protease